MTPRTINSAGDANENHLHPDRQEYSDSHDLSKAPLPCLVIVPSVCDSQLALEVP